MRPASCKLRLYRDWYYRIAAAFYRYKFVGALLSNPKDVMLTRVLIADEHPIACEGLTVHLEAQPGWSVVAETHNGKDAVVKAIETKPDVVVLAYELPLLDGVETTRLLRAELPDTEVLIFTIHNAENVLRYCLDAGARGFVLKSEPMSRLVEGVRMVAAHKPYFAPAGIEETASSCRTL
jgi:DNA-binding NarL/FixJ family response regulator